MDRRLGFDRPIDRVTPMERWKMHGRGTSTSSLAGFAAWMLCAAGISCSREAAPIPSIPTRLTLYEGLPHQLYEAERLAAERQKPTVEMGGFPFYRDPLPMDEADANSLGEILSSPATFRPFSAEKKCGGFHPDYAVVASTKEGEYAFLLCFGCYEAQVLRPDRSASRYDLGRGTTPSLSGLLTPYRRNRPEPAGGP